MNLLWMVRWRDILLKFLKIFYVPIGRVTVAKRCCLSVSMTGNLLWTVKIMLESFSRTFPKPLIVYHTASLYPNYTHMGSHYQLVNWWQVTYRIVVSELNYATPEVIGQLTKGVPQGYILMIIRYPKPLPILIQSFLTLHMTVIMQCNVRYKWDAG